MRTFVAVDPSDEIKAGIFSFLEKIKRTAPGGLSWAKPGDLHLTLKFLGEIDDASAAGAGEIIRKIAAETAVFPLTVAGTGSFPPGSPRPRVLWIGLEESTPLAALRNRLEYDLEALGFPREERPFHPHLTAARVRTAGLPSRILERFADGAASVFGTFAVRELIFYQSILRPSGAEHLPLVSGGFRP